MHTGASSTYLRIHAVLLVLLAMILASCGGGGGGSIDLNPSNSGAGSQVTADTARSTGLLVSEEEIASLRCAAFAMTAILT